MTDSLVLRERLRRIRNEIHECFRKKRGGAGVVVGKGAAMAKVDEKQLLPLQQQWKARVCDLRGNVTLECYYIR